MAGKYKIQKYKGKTKIKNLKTGDSKEFDVEKYMSGGKKKKDTDKEDLNRKQVEEINKQTGISFTDEGANFLFETGNDAAEQIKQDNLKMGRYSNSGYFNVKNQGGNYLVYPTASNPQNAQGYKKQLAYLQEMNPDAVLDPYAYRQFNQRLEYGGKLDKYNYGGEGECEPWDIECIKRNQAGTVSLDGSLEGFSKSDPTSRAIDMNPPIDYDYFNDPENIMNGQQERPNVEVLGEGLKSAEAKPFNTTIGRVDTSGLSDTVRNDYNPKTQDIDYNLFNQYAGVDIPTAAYTLGQGIENKDTLTTVASSLKLATGLGRNIVGGMGQQNRYNQVMGDSMDDIKRKRNQPQYLAYGGKKDEDIATGEYIRGVENENTDSYNAEIEKGEYFQTNEV